MLYDVSLKTCFHWCLSIHLRVRQSPLDGDQHGWMLRLSSTRKRLRSPARG